MGRVRLGFGSLGKWTHLREEANEKWAGVLGEKLRGLSSGLLPVAEKGRIFRPGVGGNSIRLLDPKASSTTDPAFSPAHV